MHAVHVRLCLCVCVWANTIGFPIGFIENQPYYNRAGAVRVVVVVELLKLGMRMEN